MQIDIVIPEWAGEHTLYLLSGFELAAYKEIGKSWQVKTVDGRCSCCGACCVINGVTCQFLVTQPIGKRCSLGLGRHFDCCVLVPNNFVCTQRLDEQPTATGAPNLSVEVPDWVREKTIYLLSGIELVAYRQSPGPWMIKTRRCAQCANCCKLAPCSLLEKGPTGWLCSRSADRPFHCCVAVAASCDPSCKQVFEEYVPPA